MRHFSKALSLSCLLLTLSITHVYAQDFGRIIGGAVANAMRAAATQEEWRKLPPNMTRCVDLSLQMRGNNLQNFINAGVGPNDYRISQVTNLCRMFAQDLSSSVPCTIDNGMGQMVQSTCREFYMEAGTNRALSFNEAVDFANRGVRFSIGRTETTEAIKRRELAAKTEAERVERLRLQAQAEAERMRAQTKSAWDNIPTELMSCLSLGLDATPLDPQKAMDAGILPSDPRYEPYKKACSDIASASQKQGIESCERQDILQHNVPTQCQWAWHVRDPATDEAISTEDATHAWLSALYAHKPIPVDYALIEPKDVRAARLAAAENLRLQNLRERDAQITFQRASCVAPKASWFDFFSPKADDTIRAINNIASPLHDVISTSVTYLKSKPDDTLVRTSLKQRLDYEADKITPQNYTNEADLSRALTAAITEIDPLKSLCAFDLTDGFIIRLVQKLNADSFMSARLLKTPNPEQAQVYLPLLVTMPTSTYP